MADKSVTVEYLQTANFSALSRAEKLEIKAIGRPTPKLTIEQKDSKKSCTFTRKFNPELYVKHEWLCGCEKLNAIFCFPCILYGGDVSWTKKGVKDLKHVLQKVKKHEQSSTHINNILNLSLLGTIDIGVQLDAGYQLSVVRHNEQVKKNINILSKIIECIKFCGKFELPLRGHDESFGSENPGVFKGLIEFACGLDSDLKFHVENSSVFKGISKSIQNDLLESILHVCKSKIKQEINDAQFVLVMCDETTDVHGRSQMVIVVRYVNCEKPVERFWGFFNPESLSAESLFSVLSEQLKELLQDQTDKLIAQTYDGAAALSGAKSGVQTRVKEGFQNAHFLHCYAHQLNLILKKATSQNRSVRIFFNNLSQIPAFFSNSPQRMAVLESVSGRRVPRPSVTRWNFKSRTVNAVYEIKDSLLEVCSRLEASGSEETGYQAAGIKKSLMDADFLFWLDFFAKLMPHIDILYAQLQSRQIDACQLKSHLDEFYRHINKVRNDLDQQDAFPTESKRRKVTSNRSVEAKEVCDIISFQCRERFSFSGHLEANKLFLASNFAAYISQFPVEQLQSTVNAYPMLNKDKLQSELSVLYERKDIHFSNKLTDLLQLIHKTNLQSVFSETVKLLNILITTPMATAEAERCFSTLKRIKTFLRCTMTNERLTALGMLSIENAMIQGDKKFNDDVVFHFARSKNRRMEFIYK